jgi:hypothetical protein
MPRIELITWEDVAKALVLELQKSVWLTYVPPSAIFIGQVGDQTSDPATYSQFRSYLIKLVAPDSGFLHKVPKIGNYFVNHYTVGIDLWIKSSDKLDERLTDGNIETQKGIFEFFADVSRTLEHNTLNNLLDGYPGSNIGDPASLTHPNKLITGIGFFWYGRQENIK